MIKKLFKVLIIEDDEMLRDATIFAFDKYPDVKAVGAGDGSEALFKISNDNFNVILTDVMMPKLRGDDLVEILDKRNLLKDMAVFMMSASIDLDVIRKIKGHIVKAFVKPIDPNQVVDEIYQYLYLSNKNGKL